MRSGRVLRISEAVLSAVNAGLIIELVPLWLQHRRSFWLNSSVRTGYGSEGCHLSPSGQDILQPVSVNACSRGAPRTLQHLHNGLRKVRQLLFGWIDESSLLKLGEELGRGSIKIALRHCGVRFSLLLQESPDVSSIFLQQSLRAVLGMTLEMYK